MFSELKIDGELKLDLASKILYATDASAYREMPLGVAFPKHTGDVKNIITWANKHQIELVPRTAGTSLAGQVVGKGLIVDVSKHFRNILSVNNEQGHVWVEPGVIRDDLNRTLKKHQLFFGPETSTSNRCMIGGMLGNNSCGARSLVYGSVREHIVSVKGFFADGEFAHIKAISKTEFLNRINQPENSTYNTTLAAIHSILSKEENRQHILDVFPKESITRRNTGYAIDILAKSNIYTENGPDFNLCHLLAGSEGTLFFSTEIELHCNQLPPSEVALVCVHSHSVNESLKANIEALKFGPTACELMDHYILDCTKNHPTYSQYRFFVEGEPQAILIVEFAENSKAERDKKTSELKQHLLDTGLAYHCSYVDGEDIAKVWNLRKAGLGLLSNVPGDAKPAPVIEDTAVDVHDLPQFIEDFNATLKVNNLYCVHYAHAATGELHLRPILNLKTDEGKRLFRKTATDIAALVKQYRGSLSGEHGDGRLRGEFIPFMYGDQVYRWFCDIKAAFDPKNIFNPGKITATPPMDSQLRYDGQYKNLETENTIFDWSASDGFQRSVELCNGSGDCRKSIGSGGVMCPSYMATLDEKHSTRGRSNLLRDFLSQETPSTMVAEAVEEALDLCISCKACKSECPSNVDMAKIKAEYYHQKGKVSFRNKIFAYSSNIHEKLKSFPKLYNWANTSWRGSINKSLLGIHPERDLPLMDVYHPQPQNIREVKAQVVLLLDEFNANLNGKLINDCVLLLEKLGIEVVQSVYFNSARALISKGLINDAKKQLTASAKTLQNIPENIPVIGIEPSAILGFRDEYTSLFPGDNTFWSNMKKRVVLVEEYLHQFFEKHPACQKLFSDKQQTIHYHGHCHQKALSKNQFALDILAFPKNNKVVEIKSTCCGMAGSFGYEKEHFDLSKKIAHLALIPAVKKANNTDTIAASGFSCQHQIKDFSGQDALHPVSVLLNSMT
jgi:FAD/FMN-containing dehydrogenase/Fe-S oxidoreductase